MYTNIWENFEQYKTAYNKSISCPNEYWRTQLDNLFWHTKPKEACIENEWLPLASSNLCVNCIDVHNKHKQAIIWYGDNPEERRSLTYGELSVLVQQIAILLIEHKIKKGDVVCIYMPIHYLSVAAMLACARIGAVHLVVFSGFSGDVLYKRVQESNAKLILTITEIQRGGKTINLLNTVQQHCSNYQIINLKQFEHLNSNNINNNNIAWLNNTDNGFILYTSGTSGKTKGIVHAALPYMLYVASTFKTIFNPAPNDIVFCTSDIGWITGHSYTVYAPLLLGLTTVLFSGSPIYPTPDRYWDIIEKEKVSIFYTAPTALRSLQTYDINYVNKYDLSSLKILGSVGEPLNINTWNWYFNEIGKKKCPIINTWWQTETGGIILAPLRTLKQIPGSTGYPFFGIKTEIQNGQLVIVNNWPGKYKYIIGKELTKDELDIYQTGDGAKYLDNQQIRITGRIDDIINISGHRLSTIEFEQAVSKVSGIKEVAVIDIPHEITGQTIIVFVSLNEQIKNISQEEISKKILLAIRQYIGAIAKPSKIIYLDELPKTTTGKIERFKLRQYCNE